MMLMLMLMLMLMRMLLFMCDRVEYLILDEADRLFDMGFMEQIDEIMAACTHTQLKRALFSATMMQG